MNPNDPQIAVLQTSAATIEFALNWFLQSSLLIVLGIAIGRVLQRRGSAVQSAVYRTTLAAILLCPLATFALSSLGVSGWSIQLPDGYQLSKRDQPSLADFIKDDLSEAVVASVVAPTSNADATKPNSSGSSAEWIDAQPVVTIAPPALPMETAEASPVVDAVAADQPPTVIVAEMWDFNVDLFGLASVLMTTIWLVTSLVLLIQLARAWRSLAKLRRDAHPVEPEIESECRQIAKRMDVATPAVLCSPYLPSPCLAGIRRPVVLLSEQEHGLSIRDVFVHELAHLRRHDCLWNLLRRFATALLCFQPLLWWLSRAIETTAEEVCDDHVVHFGGDRTEYANRLVNVAELSSIPAAPAGVGIVSIRSMLARRVERIMDTSRTLSTRIGNLLLALVLISGLVGTATVGLVGLESNAQPIADDSGPQDDRPSKLDDQVGERVKLSGTVVGPDGKPIGGARIEVITMTYYNVKLEKLSLAETISDADGHFQASFLKSAVPATDRPADARSPVCVIVSMSGYAPGWVFTSKQPDDAPLTLRLAKDDTPIRGRILDLEGNPVSGIEVSIDKVSFPTDANLDPWLAAIGRGELMREANNRYLFSLIKPPTAYPTTKVRTDSNGVFRFSGIGNDRVVEVSLQGESIAYTTAAIVTRKMDSMIALDGFQSPGLSFKKTVYGGECQITAEPTQPIVGVVRDAETGQPMAGVTIEPYRMSKRMAIGRGQIQVTSDQQGRFRLVGMPKGPGRQVMVDPNDDQPYLMRRFDVSDRPGLDPIEMNLELHRGVWITGKISDKQSGKPVGGEAAARMYYFPYRDNPHAAALPEYQGFDAHGDQHRYPVNADGSYRLVGLPGNAIVGIAVFNKVYPWGMGSAEIDEVHDRSHGLTFGAPGIRPPTDRWPTAMKKITVAEGTEEIQVDFELDSGRSIQLTVLDDQGAEIQGLKVCGARYRTFWYTMDSPTFDAVALADSEERTMLFHHPERKLGKAMQVKVNDRSPDSMTVKLEPCVTIRGQLLDDNELPIAAATISILPRPGGHDSPSLEAVKTDANGRFSHDGVLPGTQYDVVSESVEVGSKVLARELTVQAGETIDLGAIDATSDERPEPMRSTVAAAAQTSTSGESNQESLAITFAGTVVDPNGKPVGGASIYHMFYRRQPVGLIQPTGTPATTTNPDGTFHFVADSSELPVSFLREKRDYGFLVATKPGFGFAWSAAGAFDASGEWENDMRQRLAVVAEEFSVKYIKRRLSQVGKPLRLINDQPIRGRVVDINGQPVAGAKLMLFSAQGNIDNDLSEWRKAVSKPKADFLTANSTVRQYLTGSHVRSLVSPATTDQNGSFEINGVGGGRLCELLLTGTEIESTKLRVRTETGEPIQVDRQRDMPQLGKYTYYPVEFSFAVGPSVPIVGVVRDLTTKAPIAGITVKSQKRHGEPINGSGQDFVRAITDDQGRYRLTGMPIGDDNRIAAVAPDGDVAYVSVSKQAETTSQQMQCKVDLKMPRGVWISGRVTDNATGSGVYGILSHFVPKQNGSSYMIARSTNVNERDRLHTKHDGRFRIAVLPGRGYLGIMARTNNEDYSRAKAYRSLDGEMIDVPERLVRTRPSYLVLANQNAVIEFDAPANAEVENLDIQLDSGLKVFGRVVSAAGDPISDYYYTGRMESFATFRSSTTEKFYLSGYDPKSTRHVYVVTQDHKYAGYRSVTGEVKEEVVVQLEWAGRVTGRLVDTDGAPLAHHPLNRWYPHFDSESERRKFHVPPLPRNTSHNTVAKHETDGEGRFEITGLVPGIEYRLGASRREQNKRQVYIGPMDVVIQVKPGEEKDLGDVFLADKEEFQSKALAAANNELKGADKEMAPAGEAKN